MLRRKDTRRLPVIKCGKWDGLATINRIVLYYSTSRWYIAEYGNYYFIFWISAHEKRINFQTNA